MERASVVNVLKRVAPALGTKDILPVLACFCFDGKNVTAYDDVVALRAPFPSPIVGGVRGRLLLDFLTACRGKYVDLKTDETSSVLIKSGRAKLNQPLLARDSFIFMMPKTEGATEVSVSGPFLGALNLALVSMGRDSTYPWMLGVTVQFGEKGATLFSTDNRSATKVFLKGMKGPPNGLTVVLPPRFCELLSDVGREDKIKSLAITKEWSIAVFASGLRLFSRTVQTSDVRTYQTIFKEASTLKDSLVDVPKGLDRALEQALAVMPWAAEKYTKLEVRGGDLIVTTISQAGNVRNQVPMTGHEAVRADVPPDALLRALSLAEKILVSEKYVLLSKGTWTHLVTTVLQSGVSAPAADEDLAEEE